MDRCRSPSGFRLPEGSTQVYGDDRRNAVKENWNWREIREKSVLVLSRKIGERIVAPDCELVVSVLAIEGNRVRLGICASDGVTVYRKEVYQQIRLQKQIIPEDG